MPATEISPENKTLPTETALAILDIADKNNWAYAPLNDGCYNRKEMEAYLADNPNAEFSLVINYKEDYADSVAVSVCNGKITLEVVDHFYTDYKHIDSLDELKDVAWSMVVEYNSQP